MTDAKAFNAEGTSVPATAIMSSSQEALDLDQLPKGYYRSKNFIGSLIAVCLMAISLYLGYVLPVCYSVVWETHKSVTTQELTGSIGQQFGSHQQGPRSGSQLHFDLDYVHFDLWCTFFLPISQKQKQNHRILTSTGCRPSRRSFW